MKKAFSLLELMIVILILGLLAAFVLPSLMGKGAEAKQKLTCTQMKMLDGALKNFKIDNGRYPSTEEGMLALVTNPDPSALTTYSPSGYLEGGKAPKDSWDGDFVYLYDQDKIELISLGSDKKEGGEGEAADIYLSTCK